MPASLASCLAFYEARGVHLLSVLCYVLMDGTTAQAFRVKGAFRV